MAITCSTLLAQAWQTLPPAPNSGRFLLRLGSCKVGVEVYGEGWLEPMTTGLHGVSPWLEDGVEFSIKVVGRPQLEQLPTFPVEIDQDSSRGRIEPLCDENCLAVAPPHGMHLADRQEGRALVYYEQPEAIPTWDRCAPLRTVLGFLGPQRGLHLLHGAVVTRDGSGLLLIGPGGSGKTSSALATLREGSRLGFLAEDYTAVEEASLSALPLYRSFKVGAQGLQRMPWLSSYESLGEQDGKGCFLLPAERLSGPVSLIGIVWPDLRGPGGLTTIGRAEALRRLAPSSLMQNPNAGALDFRALADLCRRLPSYRMGLSDHPAAGEVEQRLTHAFDLCRPLQEAGPA